MATEPVDNTDEVLKVLTKHDIMRTRVNEATEITHVQGDVTNFAVVDALTRLAGRLQNAGERSEVTAKPPACSPWPPRFAPRFPRPRTTDASPQPSDCQTGIERCVVDNQKVCRNCLPKRELRDILGRLVVWRTKCDRTDVVHKP